MKPTLTRGRTIHPILNIPTGTRVEVIGVNLNKQVVCRLPDVKVDTYWGEQVLIRDFDEDEIKWEEV